MKDSGSYIRSFVMRAGRMTEGQKKGWDQGFPRFGLTIADGVFNWDELFGGHGKRVLEIGFGMGDSLLTMAEMEPDTQFVGIEVYKPGVGRLLSKTLGRNIENIRVYVEDAVLVLKNCIAQNSLDVLQIYFPDPWHKKRHNKRRLVQPIFIAMAVSRIIPGGIIHLATDFKPYAESMLEIMEAELSLENIAGAGQYSERPVWRPETKFERRGIRLGHGVWDLLYRKK